jgi:sterol desaturase/sphingolipid hydroxylase (fatty acid hydroxylase superfamily)
VLNPIVLAAPVFVLAMLGEWAWGRRQGREVYDAADTVSSLANGILSQLVGIFTTAAVIALYAWVWQGWHWLSFDPASPWTWLLALVLYDFLYYWHHRFGHTVAILWAAHEVHHSSERYNLSTALRQTSSDALFGWLFHLPLALLGVPVEVFVGVGLIDLLYQFWVHTELVGKLGWFDRWLCSPSNHRVHHGQNDYCLDRNYGGIFMVWDRMFGSFVEEREGEPIVYGTLNPLQRWSPLAANLRGYRQIWQDCRLAERWSEKLTIWFRHPGWRPEAAQRLAPKPSPDLAHFQRFSPPLPEGLPRHGLEQLGVLLLAAVGLLALAPLLGPGMAALGTLGAAAGLVALGRCLEGRGLGIEWARLALAGLLGALLGLLPLPWPLPAPPWALNTQYGIAALLLLGSAWGAYRLAALARR